MKRTFYYARVSTAGQNLARQINEFKSMGADDHDIITDKATGKSTDRPGYNMLKNYLLRPGDTLVIKSLDRLSRRKADIKAELEYFRDNKIRLKILDIPTTLTEYGENETWVLEMVNSILIEVFSALAESEYNNIRQRQQDGVQAMPKNKAGKRISSKTGRPAGRPEIGYPENWQEVYAEVIAGSITKAEARNRTGLKKSTFRKLELEYLENMQL